MQSLGTEAPLVRGGTEDICEFLLMFLSTLLQSSSLQDFLKRLFVYYQSYQQHVHYASVALCAFGTSVRLSLYFHLRVLPLSV